MAQFEKKMYKGPTQKYGVILPNADLVKKMTEMIVTELGIKHWFVVKR